MPGRTASPRRAGARSPSRGPRTQRGSTARASKAGRPRRGSFEQRDGARSRRRRRDEPEPAWASTTLRAASDWISATGESALALLENAAQGEQPLLTPAARPRRGSWELGEDANTTGGRALPAPRQQQPQPSPSPRRRSPSPEPEPEAEPEEPEAVLSKLETFKGMMDRGLITKADYDSQKRLILTGERSSSSPPRARSPGRSPQLALPGPGSAPRSPSPEEAKQQLLFFANPEDPTGVEVTAAELRELYLSNEVHEEADVWLDGWDDWVPLREQLEEIGVLTADELACKVEQQAQEEREAAAEAERLERQADRERSEQERAAQAEKDAAEAAACKQTQQEQQADMAARRVRDEADADRAKRDDEERKRKAAEWWWPGDGEWEGKDHEKMPLQYTLETRELDSKVAISLKTEGVWKEEGNTRYTGSRIEGLLFNEQCYADLSRDGERLVWSDGDEWTRISRRTTKKGSAGAPTRGVTVEVLGWETVEDHVVYVLKVAVNDEEVKLVKRRWQDIRDFEKGLKKQKTSGDEWEGAALQTGGGSIGFDEAKIGERIKQLNAFFGDFSEWAGFLVRKQRESVDFFAPSSHSQSWIAPIRTFLTRDSTEPQVGASYNGEQYSPSHGRAALKRQSAATDGGWARSGEDTALTRTKTNMLVNIKLQNFETVPVSPTNAKEYTQYNMTVTTRGTTSPVIGKRWSELSDFDVVLKTFSTGQPAGSVRWTGKLPSRLRAATTRKAKIARQGELQLYVDKLSRWARNFHVKTGHDLFDPACPKAYRKLLQNFFGFAPDGTEAAEAYDNGGAVFGQVQPVSARVIDVDTESSDAVESKSAFYVIEFDARNGRAWSTRNRWSEVVALDTQLVESSVRLAAPAKWKKAQLPTHYTTAKTWGGDFNHSALAGRKETLNVYFGKFALWATLLAQDHQEDIFNKESFPEMIPFLNDQATAATQATLLREMGAAAPSVRQLPSTMMATPKPPSLDVAVYVEDIEMGESVAKYKIRIEERSTGREWTCKKRWSDLVKLNEDLRKIKKIEGSVRWSYKSIAKSTGDKKFTGGFNDSELQKRKDQLQVFWNHFAQWANRLSGEFGEDVFAPGSSNPNCADFVEVQDFLGNSLTAAGRVPEQEEKPNFQPQPEPEPEPEPELEPEPEPEPEPEYYPLDLDPEPEYYPLDLDPEPEESDELAEEPEAQLQLLHAARSVTPIRAGSPVGSARRSPSPSSSPRDLVSAGPSTPARLTLSPATRAPNPMPMSRLDDAATAARPPVVTTIQRPRPAISRSPPPSIADSTEAEPVTVPSNWSVADRAIAANPGAKLNANPSIYTHMQIDLRDLKTLLEDGIITQDEFDQVKRERLHGGLWTGWDGTAPEKTKRWEQELKWEAKGMLGQDTVRSRWEREATLHGAAATLSDARSRSSRNSSSSSPGRSSPRRSPQRARSRTPQRGARSPQRGAVSLQRVRSPVRVLEALPARLPSIPPSPHQYDSSPETEVRSVGDTMTLSDALQDVESSLRVQEMRAHEQSRPMVARRVADEKKRAAHETARSQEEQRQQQLAVMEERSRSMDAAHRERMLADAEQQRLAEERATALQREEFERQTAKHERARRVHLEQQVQLQQAALRKNVIPRHPWSSSSPARPPLTQGRIHRPSQPPPSRPRSPNPEPLQVRNTASNNASWMPTSYRPSEPVAVRSPSPRRHANSSVLQRPYAYTEGGYRLEVEDDEPRRRQRSPPRFVTSPSSGERVHSPTYYEPDRFDAERKAREKADAYHAAIERNSRYKYKALRERSGSKQRERDRMPLHSHGSPERFPQDRWNVADARYAMSPVKAKRESRAHQHADRGVSQAPDDMFKALPRSPPPSAMPVPRSVGNTGLTSDGRFPRDESPRSPDAVSVTSTVSQYEMPRRPNAAQDRMIYSKSAQKEIPAKFVEKKGGYAFYSYRVDGRERIKQLRDGDDADGSEMEPECERCMRPLSMCSCSKNV